MPLVFMLLNDHTISQVMVEAYLTQTSIRIVGVVSLLVRRYALKDSRMRPKQS